MVFAVYKRGGIGMGSGSWSSEDWKAYASKKGVYSGTARGIYTSRNMKKEFDPKRIDFRESCDSEEHPNTTAVIVGLDVTGSMSPVLESAVKNLNTLVTEIYKRKPVSDPHLMFMGIGDVICDRAPLQVTQFEADIRIAKQLTELWFEQGGGGNKTESYTLPWYFAANHTKIDCFEKRKEKGFLFTIGDEMPPSRLTAEQIEQVTGDEIEYDSFSTGELLREVSKKYEVFHFIIAQGSNCRAMGLDNVKEKWNQFLGERAIVLEDCNKIAEIIVSTLQLLNGENIEKIANSWDKATSKAVKHALMKIDLVDKSNKLIDF